MIYFVIFLEFILDFLSESITIERERTALCGRVVFGGSGFWRGLFVGEGCLERLRDIRRGYHDYHTEKAH